MSPIEYNQINRNLDDKRKELDKIIENIIDNKIHLNYKSPKLNKKAIFTEEYLSQNNHSECETCDISKCFLKQEYQCPIIGIKIEEVSSNEDFQIYNVKKIRNIKP